MVKDAIEELIEENYVDTLSKEEIDAGLDRFSQMCEKTIPKNIRDIG